MLHCPSECRLQKLENLQGARGAAICPWLT
jgi:hypothetical protein